MSVQSRNLNIGLTTETHKRKDYEKKLKLDYCRIPYDAFKKFNHVKWNAYNISFKKGYKHYSISVDWESDDIEALREVYANFKYRGLTIFGKILYRLGLAKLDFSWFNEQLIKSAR